VGVVARADVASRTIPLTVVAGLFLASFAVRPQLMAMGPLLPLIRDDLALPASLAGLLTTIPVLCMGLFAPFGPRIAVRLGPRNAMAASIAAIVVFGLLRAVMPVYPLVLLATFAIGIAMGVGGALPAMIVAQRIPMRPALGTGAYAGGIVTGSTLTAAVAVPLAIGGEWRVSLAVLAVASIGSIVGLLLLVPGEGKTPGLRVQRRRMPWGSATAWLLVAIFGLQSILYYGAVTWLPNAFVDRGWTLSDAGALVAIVNATTLVTTLGVPLVADRIAGRRPGLIVSSVISGLAFAVLILVPDLAYAAVIVLGLALGALFALVLTLPLDVADDPGSVGSVAALMFLGGYILSSTGPVVLGAVRDLTGSFDASLWLLVAIAAALTVASLLLSQARLAFRH
jgi:MFS transporter, CP family, cyanate transporter